MMFAKSTSHAIAISSLFKMIRISGKAYRVIKESKQHPVSIFPFVDSDDTISQYMYSDMLSLAYRGEYDIVRCGFKRIYEFMAPCIEVTKRLNNIEEFRTSDEICKKFLPKFVGFLQVSD